MEINNPESLQSEIVEYNPDAESAGIKRKTPQGNYLMELSLGKYGVTAKTSKGRPYISVHVNGRYIAPGEWFDNFNASGFITSLVFEDGTSTVHTLLKRVGTPAGARETLADLQGLVESALGGHPQVLTGMRWEARAQTSSGQWDGVKGMKNFPKLADGTYDPFIEIDGEMVEARETIYSFPLPKGAQARG